MATIPDLDNALSDTQEWIDALMSRLEWHDRQRVYLALVAGLHGLRDCVGPDEAVHIGAHLPTLLRGIYYEGWHPGERAQAKGRDSFLERIHDGVHRDPAIDPELVARAVLALVAARLPLGEVENARAATPSDLHNLWPA